jgi:hypothetical protein
MNYKEYRDEIPLNTIIQWSRTLLEGADWKPIGQAGHPGEPYRHWASYPPMQGIVKQLWDFINESLKEDGFTLTPERTIMNLYNHGDSSWIHVDSEKPDDYTVIVFLNENWSRNWGGDFCLFSGNEILHSFAATPGKFVVFKSNIEHGARPVSREAPFSRFGVAFQCKNDSNISRLSQAKITGIPSTL